jgi:hypothetical protein
LFACGPRLLFLRLKLNRSRAWASFFSEGGKLFFQFRRLLFTASLDGSVDYYVRGKKRKKEKKQTLRRRRRRSKWVEKHVFVFHSPFTSLLIIYPPPPPPPPLLTDIGD